MKPYYQRLVALIFVVSMLFMGAPWLNAQVATPSPNAAPVQSFDTNFGNTRWFPSFGGRIRLPTFPKRK